jgi:hypothetical protein
MPIPIEQIEVIEDEIVREHKAKDNEIQHTTVMKHPDQDFSFIRKLPQAKRSVCYDIEPIDRHEDRPLRTFPENEQSLDNVLRRRHVAHWGLPGLSLFILSNYTNSKLDVKVISIKIISKEHITIRS